MEVKRAIVGQARLRARIEAARSTGVEEVPTFIVGPPRSGTSLVYKVLCLHARAGYISNWTSRFGACPPMSWAVRLPRRTTSWRRSVWFGDDDNAYVYGSSRRPLAERLFPMPVEADAFFERYGLSRPKAGAPAEGVDAPALRRAFRAIRRTSASDVVISKRVVNNWYIGPLAAAFPRSKFISINRDGRGVAVSLSKVDWWADSVVPWYGGTPAEWAAEGRDPLELCARTWCEETRTVDRALESLDPKRVLRVRYEEILDESAEWFAAMAGFAGLLEDRGWNDQVDSLHLPPSKAFSWRAALGEKELSMISAIQHTQLEQLGYT